MPLPRARLVRVTLSHRSPSSSRIPAPLTSIKPTTITASTPQTIPMRPFHIHRSTLPHSGFQSQARRPTTHHQQQITLTLTRPFASHTDKHDSSSHGAAASSHDDHGDHGDHDSHYEPPGGWLWGVPPGEQAPREGWEGSMFYGYLGSFVVLAVLWGYKPDTSIQTWALEEARRRLEAEGVLEDPNPEAEKGGWDESWARTDYGKGS